MDLVVARLRHTWHPQRYLISQLGSGQTLGANALVHWQDLDQGYRRANRGQARDIGRKLKMIGCTVAPSSSLDTAFSLDDGEVDLLAVTSTVMV
jgi:hypothetical protein